MRLIWLLIMAVQMVLATYSAYAQNVAETVLFCTSAILCSQLMKKDGDGNGRA